MRACIQCRWNSILSISCKTGPKQLLSISCISYKLIDLVYFISDYFLCWVLGKDLFLASVHKVCKVILCVCGGGWGGGIINSLNIFCMQTITRVDVVSYVINSYPYRWPFQANPDPSTCLGVFGLSLYTTERDLREVFSRYGPLAGVNVVYDQRTGRSRGFAFVYFERLEDSKEVWKIFRVLFMDQMPSGLQTWCKQLIFIVILYFQVISFFLFYLLF